MVIDLETTGGSPSADTITEVGAVKVRGGEVLGTFATLVNPGRAIPPTITVLTGITEAMVTKAPRIEAVLPALLEFLGEAAGGSRGGTDAAVLVGHNVRFDIGFLQAALERDARPRLTNRTVDTAALARRLLREEVPNCKLATLAERFRLPHRPCHRALDDALATVDLLHLLVERAAAFGVMGLEDLAALPKLAGHPQAAKLRLTERLPHRPGIYLFRDERGKVLYVGKATDLRARVRSYFSGDDRRKVGALLRETSRIDHKVCSSTLEAAVLEARLIRDLTPTYNSQGTRWRRSRYVRLTTDERFPRLSVVREPRADDELVIGPLGSASAAKRVAEAIESAVPLRRCTTRLAAAHTPGPDGTTSSPVRQGACAPAQLGVATCPCTGEVTEREYAQHVDTVVDAVHHHPAGLLDPLAAHMDRLAAQERYEEAALARDRLAALSSAMRRRRRLEQLLACERALLRLADGQRVELRRGVLWQVWEAEPAPTTTTASGHVAPGTATPGLWHGQPEHGPVRAVEMRPSSLPGPTAAVPKALADELLAVAAWLEQHAGTIVPEHVDGVLASPLPRLPAFSPARA